ncbi:hypothetical protein BDZ97DRAFT_1840561 [Flammula alnicola]|nr:hypothetical protein BDZ97DRAFT_1840561 [Flammula alnicola]
MWARAKRNSFPSVGILVPTGFLAFFILESLPLVCGSECLEDEQNWSQLCAPAIPRTNCNLSFYITTPRYFGELSLRRGDHLPIYYDYESEEFMYSHVVEIFRRIDGILDPK